MSVTAIKRLDLKLENTWKTSERKEEGGLSPCFRKNDNPLIFPLFLHTCVIGLVYVSVCCLGGVSVLRHSCTQYYLFAFISCSSRRVKGRNKSAVISGFTKCPHCRAAQELLFNRDCTGAGGETTRWAGGFIPVPEECLVGDSSSGSPRTS